jgi:hypothetical protein
MTWQHTAARPEFQGQSGRRPAARPEYLRRFSHKEVPFASEFTNQIMKQGGKKLDQSAQKVAQHPGDGDVSN